MDNDIRIASISVDICFKTNVFLDNGKDKMVSLFSFLQSLLPLHRQLESARKIAVAS